MMHGTANETVFLQPPQCTREHLFRYVAYGPVKSIEPLRRCSQMGQYQQTQAVSHPIQHVPDHAGLAEIDIRRRRKPS